MKVSNYKDILQVRDTSHKRSSWKHESSDDCTKLSKRVHSVWLQKTVWLWHWWFCIHGRINL